MEGMIDSNGYLWIKRRGTELKIQSCKYSSRPCGDLCPFFGEIVETTKNIEDELAYKLDLCDGLTLHFKKIN